MNFFLLYNFSLSEYNNHNAKKIAHFILEMRSIFYSLNPLNQHRYLIKHLEN